MRPACLSFSQSRETSRHFYLRAGPPPRHLLCSQPGWRFATPPPQQDTSWQFSSLPALANSTPSSLSMDTAELQGRAEPTEPKRVKQQAPVILASITVAAAFFDCNRRHFHHDSHRRRRHHHRCPRRRLHRRCRRRQCRPCRWLNCDGRWDSCP